MKFPDKLFISGTDTDIGKTVISSMLVAGLKAGYWKPVQAGKDPITDTQFVRKTTGFEDSHFYPERFLLTEPMSPHAAAEIDNVSIRLDDFKIPKHTQKHLIIEGAGGLIVPLNDTDYVIDLISKLQTPTLLVAKSGLGTLNHTLLSVEALQRRKIELFGIVLVGDRHPSNEETIKKMSGTNHLWTIPILESINPHSLAKQFKETFALSGK